MNENGVVNIYMIVLAYMFSPSTDIDEEILVDDDGNVQKSCNENLTMQVEDGDKAVGNDSSEDDSMEKITAIEMKSMGKFR